MRRLPRRSLFWLTFALMGALLAAAAVRAGPAPVAAAGESPLIFPTPVPGDEKGQDLSQYERIPVCSVKQDANREILRLPPIYNVPCEGGVAAGFDCQNIDLAALLPLADIGGAGAQGNDIWGWTDPVTGQEIALMGLTNGVAFVDVTNPTSPVHLGNLPSHTGNSIWRDVKVYADHAFVVADLNGSHGVQVFDLTQLRSVVSPPVTFSETAHYSGIGSAHNIVINEATGYAYAVGGSSGNTCSGGLHMIDISNPTSPLFAGCYAGDGYTHDAQCVIYDGPDTDYQGQEICFGANEDTITLVDVTNKAAPVQISRTGYAGRGYTHQNWLTEDHRYLLLNDELDEQIFGNNTRTFVWDMLDLDNPVLVGTNNAGTTSIDHNLYTHEGLVYEANYRSGLRVMDLASVGTASLPTVGYFDIFPGSDTASFNGAWSVYPYFESGTVIVSGIEQGLVVLQPQALDPAERQIGICADGAGATTVTATEFFGSGASVLLDTQGLPPGALASYDINPLLAPGSSTLTINTVGVAPGSYPFEATGTSGARSEAAAMSLAVSATPPGVVTLAGPPNGAVGQPVNPILSWNATGPGDRYTIEIALDAAFTNIVHSASGLSGTSYPSPNLNTNSRYHWRVRAENSCGGGAFSTPFTFVTQPAPGDCSATQQPVTLFSTNFEGDTSGWLVAGGQNNTWAVSSARSNSGLRSFFAQDLSTTSDQRLVSPQVVLPTGARGLTLSFWNHQTLEDRAQGCYDGAVLEILTSSNPIWSQITTGLLTDPYDGPLTASNPLGAVQAWCGDPQDWSRSVIDLAPYAGSAARFRFRVGTDPSVGRSDGWYVDDVELKACQPLQDPALVRSAAILLGSRPLGSYRLVSGFVVVRNGVGTAVSNATVNLTWIRPGGGTTSQSVQTNAVGLATIATVGPVGSYTARVDNITKAGLTFDPANSFLTRTLIVP